MAAPPRTKTRAQVVQAMLRFFDAPRYLEVGVFRGETFFAVEASAKVAVDPAFQFDSAAAAAEHPHCRFHAVTSDAYFGALDRTERFEVIYLDGLHTADQTLRDLLNAIGCLAPGGIIVVDDVFPSSLAAAATTPERADGLRKRLGVGDRDWMGDVYRLVPFVDSFLQRWSFRCVADNHGQLVMWEAPRAAVEPRLLGAVVTMGYDDALLERRRFRFARLATIVSEIAAARG